MCTKNVSSPGTDTTTGSPLSPFPPDPSRQEARGPRGPRSGDRRPPDDAGNGSTLHHRSTLAPHLPRVPEILLSPACPSSSLCAAREGLRSPLDQSHRELVVVALAGDLAVPSAPLSPQIWTLMCLWMFSVIFCTQGVCVFVRASFSHRSLR